MRRGEREKGRRGENPSSPPSPFLPFSPSPFLPFSFSPSFAKILLPPCQATSCFAGGFLFVDPSFPDALMTSDEIAELRKKHYNATIASLALPNEDLMIVRVRPDAGVQPHRAGQYS